MTNVMIVFNAAVAEGIYSEDEAVALMRGEIMEQPEYYIKRAETIMRNIRRKTPPYCGRRKSCETAIYNFTVYILAISLSRRENPDYKDRERQQQRINDIKAVYKQHRTGEMTCTAAMTRLCEIFNK